MARDREQSRTQRLAIGDKKEKSSLEKRISDLNISERKRFKTILTSFLEVYERDYDSSDSEHRERGPIHLDCLDIILNGRQIMVLDEEKKTHKRILNSVHGTRYRIINPRNLNSAQRLIGESDSCSVVIYDPQGESGRDSGFWRDNFFKSLKMGQGHSLVYVISSISPDESESMSIKADRVITRVLEGPETLEMIDEECGATAARLRIKKEKARENLKQNRFKINFQQPELDIDNIDGVIGHSDIEQDKIHRWLAEALSQRIEKKEGLELICDAQSLSTGDASGIVYANIKKAKRETRRGRYPIVVVPGDIGNLPLDDINAIKNCAGGIICGAASGTNHHIIDLMGMGVPILVYRGMSISDGLLLIGNRNIPLGQHISVSGVEGKIYLGAADVKRSLISQVRTDPQNSEKAVLQADKKSKDDLEKFEQIMKAASAVIRGRTGVMVNASDVEIMRHARAYGVDSVGLVRTEDILKQDPNNTMAYGAYMLAVISGEEKLKERLRQDFVLSQAEPIRRILEYQGSRITQIRLLDPPLKEFFGSRDIKKIVESIGEEDSQKRNNLEKMMRDFVEDPLEQRDVRGVIIGERFPDIYQAQLSAIFSAVLDNKKNRGSDIEGYERPTGLRIFIPYVLNTNQVEMVLGMAESNPVFEEEKNEIMAEMGVERLEEMFGVTLETPGGLICSPDMLKLGIRCFTFGTNDLLSLLDGGDRALASDEESPALKPSHKTALRQTLVGLAEQAYRLGILREDYRIGISGEMNREKIEFFRTLLPGLDYVSASRPSQIPSIVLTLAHAYMNIGIERMRAGEDINTPTLGLTSVYSRQKDSIIKS